MHLLSRRSVLSLGFALFAAFAAPLHPVQAEEPVTVFAAASLKTALDKVNAAFTADTGHAATASYAASSALAKQVQAAAPADIFISADLAWMDTLAKDKLIKDDSRFNLLGNTLVLVGAKDAKPVEISKTLDLSALLGDGKLAMGLVDSVPAGKYGKQALESLGLWAAVEPKVAGAENVRAALLLVARGEAPFGIVYKTDAVAEPAVAVVGTFPEDSHKPIIYPAAIIAASQNANAEAYLTYLKSDKAAEVFKAEGFEVLK